ncbi:SdrD B-like domain-containing protein [Nostoc sp. CCY0012]|uniref:SdrD B-like domain-containing protein n=1 Tax=Nostoc sp. CCY0012 TaxID=1056123 RepID=UPI0039C61579
MNFLFKKLIPINQCFPLGWHLGIAGAIAMVTASPVAAQVGITGVTATYQTGTFSTYSTQVGNPCSTGNYPGGCGSNIDLQFGVGATNDLVLSGFQVGTQNYTLINLADSVEFRRINNANTTGERQLVFFPSVNNTQMRSSYTNTMAEAMLSTIINRGIDNAFSNDASTASNNIERIDYIISAGLAVPNASLGNIGFLILERGGNDPFKIAAITELDANGNPSKFGPLKNVPANTWGNSGTSITSAVMRREELEPVFRPSHTVPSQSISGIYISISSLDMTPGEKIYGYALFPSDITDSNDLINLTDFPLTTSGASGAGGLDLMAGGGIFMLDGLTTISGNLYKDENNDSNFNNGEPTLPANISVRLINASNTVIATANTGSNGEYLFTGIPNGNYTIQVDTNDPDIPNGHTLTTANNLAVNLSGTPVTNQNFGFNQPVASNPNIILVKRITALNSTRYTDLIDGVNDINSPHYVPAPHDADDNHPNWFANYLQGRLNGGTVLPEDELEYTIYFLSTGDSTAPNVLMCDRLPQNTTFIPTAFNNGLLGADKGILLSYNGDNIPLTNIADGDGGQYFPPGVEPTTVYPNIDCGGVNHSGVVVVNLGDVPPATSPGTPSDSYGFIRFWAKIK